MSDVPRSKYSGADWLRSNLAAHRTNVERQNASRRRGKPIELPSAEVSEFGALVADILGAAWLGLYHMDDSQILKAKWSDERHISIKTNQELATFDGSELAWLVVLCHDAGVRFAIRGRFQGDLELAFTRRHVGPGSVWDRHPTMEQAVEVTRTKLFDARPRAQQAPSESRVEEHSR